MAYETEDLFEKAKKAIEKHKLFFVEDIVAYLPCSKPTFYEHFPVESNELNELKELTTKNKTEVKVKLRKNWQSSEAPALQLALYKLAATPEELKLLQMQYHEHTGEDGGPIQWHEVKTYSTPDGS